MFSEISNKKTFLALCLYEAIEDRNLMSIELLVEKHGANPNTIISDRQISPFHFIVGIEDQSFAVKITKFFLKNGADPNNPSACDGKLTPLHIACIWGHERIVSLLLEHGGNLNIKCGEGKTPILYAIHENHYDVIDVIKKFIFEKKIEKKKKEVLAVEQCYDSPSKPKDPVLKHNVVQALQKIEEKKFTPNRINYNFDVTSPYYINITHRRFKSSKCSESSPSTISNETFVIKRHEEEKEQCRQKNLFELTEKNLFQFSKEIAQTIIDDPRTMEKRRSYIADWQNKIQQIRNSDNKIDIDYLNYLNACNDVNMSKIGDYPATEKQSSDAEESFVTAQSDVNDNMEKFQNIDENLEKFYVKKEPKEKESFMIQVTEEYIHSDQENGIIFLEKKIFNENNNKKDSVDEDSDSDTSVATRITLPPLDYDTDVLRAELTKFGEAPGPITKSTKKLYLRQLVKYKKDPERMIQQQMMKSGKEKVYSVELQRTITKFSYLEENLPEFLDLERQMSECFQKPNSKWREGHLKTSFIYLLIDPRVCENLSLLHKNLDKEMVWKKFLESIFYVGKGKRSRPYAHLYDAIKVYSLENAELAQRLENRKNQMVEKCIVYSSTAEKNELVRIGKQKMMAQKTTDVPTKFQESKKLNKIIEIWKSELGVVCLHIFHNIMPVDAMTREAAIIDAIGLHNLTNMKKGDYYGLASTWKMRTKKNLGIGLLHKALHVYLAEGESQLMPFDLV